MGSMGLLLQNFIKLIALVAALSIFFTTVAYADGDGDRDFEASISQNGGDKWYPDENVEVRWSSDVEDDDNILYTVVTLHSVSLGKSYIYCSDFFRHFDNPNGYRTCSSSDNSNSGSRSWTVGEPLSNVNSDIPVPGMYRAHVSVKTSIINGDGASAQTEPFEIVGVGSCTMNTTVTSGSGTVDKAHINWDSGSETVDFEPADGWYVYKVKVNHWTLANDDGTLKHPSSHTETCNGAETFNVEVEFRRIECPITVTHNSGGEVTLSRETDSGTEILPDSYTIPAGETVTAVSLADTGSVIEEVYIEEKNILTGQVYSQTLGEGEEEFTHSYSCPESTPKRFTTDTKFRAEGSCKVTTAAHIIGQTGGSVGGTVDPLGTTIIEKDESETFNFNAEEGFRIEYVYINGEDVNGSEAGGPSSRTIECDPGDEEYDIHVYFKAKPCILTTKANDGGSISPDTQGEDPVEVDLGQYQFISIWPDSGYKLDDVKENSVSQGPVAPYRVDCEEPDTDIDVEAFFVWDGYKITSSVEGSHGTIDPLGETELAMGETQDFVIIPDNEYIIEWVKIDGVIDPLYTHRVGTTVITLGADLSDDTPDRTIKVKFMLACKIISPEETLANLREGRPAQINESSFRKWVNKKEDRDGDGIEEVIYEELVKAEMSNSQCEYISNQASVDEEILSDLMHRTITSSILPLVNEDKPAVGAFYLVVEVERRTDRGHFIERYNDIFPHAILITDMNLSVQKSNPPVTVYNVDYLDSNGPREGTLRCEGKFEGAGGGRVISCTIPSYYRAMVNSEETSPDGIVTTVTAIRLYLVVTLGMEDINYELLSLSEVRDDSTSWIEKNYTLIDNFGTPGSPQGSCVGWSEFNARAAQLIKECPWVEDSQKDSDEEGDK